jgi:hypothetical protein
MIGMTIELVVPPLTGFVLPPRVAMSFSDSVPMPSRSAFFAATAGKAATPRAKAMRAGVRALGRSAGERFSEVDMALRN